MLPDVDLIVQPSWLAVRPAGAERVQGFGDTNLDAKWRFHRLAPWSFAVRSGFTLATAQRGLGLPRGRTGVHAVAVASYEAGGLAAHGNVGFAHNPGGNAQRDNLAHVSSALMWTLDPRWTLTAEAAIESSPERGSTSWRGGLLVGAICTVRPGFDVDVGYRRSMRASPSVRVWLAGVTYRFVA